MSAEFWRPEEKVSEDFRWREFAVSKSHPELVEPVPDEYRENVVRLATRILQPIRSVRKRPIDISSGYRSPALNLAVGGSPTSQHVRADAADHSDGDPLGEFEQLVTRAIEVPCGQCIYYPSRGFIHIANPSNRFPEPTFQLHEPQKGFTYQRVTSLGALRSFLARLSR